MSIYDERKDKDFVQLAFCVLDRYSSTISQNTIPEVTHSKKTHNNIETTRKELNVEVPVCSPCLGVQHLGRWDVEAYRLRRQGLLTGGLLYKLAPLSLCNLIVETSASTGLSRPGSNQTPTFRGHLAVVLPACIFQHISAIRPTRCLLRRPSVSNKPPESGRC